MPSSLSPNSQRRDLLHEESLSREECRGNIHSNQNQCAAYGLGAVLFDNSTGAFLVLLHLPNASLAIIELWDNWNEQQWCFCWEKVLKLQVQVSNKTESHRNSDLWPPLGWEGGEESARNQLQPGSRINSQETSSCCSCIAIESSLFQFQARSVTYLLLLGVWAIMPKWDPILAGITGLWLPHKFIHFLPERSKMRIILQKTWIQSSPWFLYMSPALSASILLKFLNLLCVPVSLSSPVFSFKKQVSTVTVTSSETGGFVSL